MDEAAAPRVRGLGSIGRWFWAAMWGAFLLLIFALLLVAHWCTVEAHPLLSLLAAWLWLVLFVKASNGVRVVLALLAIAGVFLLLPSNDPPSAFVEAHTVATLRSQAKAIESYKQSHPSQGYPDQIAPVDCPCESVGYYWFRYSPENSAASAVAEGFTLSAVPIYHKGRRLRGFAMTEGGRLYSTYQDRAATRTDEQLR